MSTGWIAYSGDVPIGAGSTAHEAEADARRRYGLAPVQHTGTRRESGVMYAHRVACLPQNGYEAINAGCVEIFGERYGRLVHHEADGKLTWRIRGETVSASRATADAVVFTVEPMMDMNCPDCPPETAVLRDSAAGNTPDALECQACGSLFGPLARNPLYIAQAASWPATGGGLCPSGQRHDWEPEWLVADPWHGGTEHATTCLRCGLRRVRIKHDGPLIHGDPSGVHYLAAWDLDLEANE